MAEPTPQKETDPTVREFEEQAGRSSHGLLVELFWFLAHNKKWWLIPVIVVLMLIGVLVVLGGTGAAPFIYTLF